MIVPAVVGKYIVVYCTLIVDSLLLWTCHHKQCSSVLGKNYVFGSGIVLSLTLLYISYYALCTARLLI